MLNVLAKVPQGNTETVAAMLDPKPPVLADMLRQAREEITAFADFPEAHRRKCGEHQPVGAV
jgi:putative transposase